MYADWAEWMNVIMSLGGQFLKPVIWVIVCFLTNEHDQRRVGLVHHSVLGDVSDGWSSLNNWTVYISNSAHYQSQMSFFTKVISPASYC